MVLSWTPPESTNPATGPAVQCTHMMGDECTLHHAQPNNNNRPSTNDMTCRFLLTQLVG